jgi:hypothetical protein
MYQNKLIEKINSNKANPKERYKCSRKLTKKQSSNSITSLNYNNIIALSDQKKAEILTDFFSSKSEVDVKDSTLPPRTETNIPVLSNTKITQHNKSLKSIRPRPCKP